jgi:growth hormone-inducible transmembrane protein
MFFLNPAILSRAGLYTVGALSGLCYVGATAKSETFMNMGGVLMCGLGVLVAASLAPMVLPRMMTVQRLSVLEHVTAYGGVGLFSMFILYDTQKVRLVALTELFCRRSAERWLTFSLPFADPPPCSARPTWCDAP